MFTERILSKNYKSIQAAQQIRRMVEDTRNRILMTVFQKRDRTTADAALNSEILRLLTFCRENITEPGERAIIAGLFDNYHRLDSVIRELGGGRPSRLPERYPNFISLSAEFMSGLDELVRVNETAMEAAEEKTKQMAGRALRHSISLLAAAMLFTVLFSYLLASKMSKPLINLAGTLSAVREGSGSYPKIPVTTRDEIGFLTAEFNRLFERLKLYDQMIGDKLMAEKRKVRRAEEAKSRFIADLSHQLKTPMTSLLMSIGILAEKADRLSADKRSRLLETAREDCSKLSALINELVDISRMDAMVEPRPKERLHMEAVVFECLKPLIRQAEEKSIHLEIDLEPGLPPVTIDSLRFPWVFTNLVGNALRYSDRGGAVTVRVARKGQRIYVQCIDRGTGIDSKYLPKIFDRYTQFSEREKSGAIGLGLAIVKEIIEAHGGDIRVESSVGAGTTFTFWIPLEEAVDETDSAD
ncbi:MAG: HAMP domain-containing sensor histidine kinase [Thermodesulfobacteriota bacterium]